VDSIAQKDKMILTVQDMKLREEQYIFKINELQKRIDDKKITIRDLIVKCEKSEKELKEYVIFII
jgi:hypothetical protein